MPTDPPRRYFVSSHGRSRAEAHMRPGDQFLPTLLRLRGLTNFELHVVGALPSGMSAADLQAMSARVVWHDARINPGVCEEACPFAGALS